MAVDVADVERRARDLLAPGVHDYFAGGSGRGLRAGEDVLAALAPGARAVAEIPEVTGPPTGNSLDT